MHRQMMRLANWLAIFGGLILLALVAITVISVAGRSANSIGHMDFIQTHLPTLASLFTGLGPILGDFELVEAGVAVAIMAFLPVCQLNRGHASVELFTHLLSARLSLFLAFLWEALFAFVFVIITWRLFVGTSDKLRYGETTFLLQFPIWWGYALCAIIGVMVSVVAIYSVWLRWRDMRDGTNMPQNAWGMEP